MFVYEMEPCVSRINHDYDMLSFCSECSNLIQAILSVRQLLEFLPKNSIHIS